MIGTPERAVGLLQEGSMESEIETGQYETPALREESATPMSLLAAAVERGLSTEQLTALTDLHERWQANRAKSAFAKAMNDCQNEMPCIVRESENSHTRSTYAKLEHINSQAKPIYGKHGFALSFSEEDCPRESWKRTVCRVLHIEGHEERHFIDLPVDGTGAKGGKSSMNEVQGAISTGTYGQRILICRIFNLTIADTDLDGNRPAYDNPQASPNAPAKPAPRGQRQPEKPPEITKEQCAFALAHWRADHPQADADVPTWNKKFHTYVNWAAKRDFDASKAQNWTRADFVKVCEAVGCNPEDAPGWEFVNA
jgi:hypothetical protein